MSANVAIEWKRSRKLMPTLAFDYAFVGMTTNPVIV
jgi:hypothetical protein